MSLELTAFESAKKRTKGTHVFLTHAEFENLLGHETRPDKDGPCFLPGPVGPGRGGRTPKYTTLVPLDVDDAPINALLEAISKAEALGWTFWAYSTHSSTDEQPRLRFVWPMAGQLTREEHRDVWERLNLALGSIGDEACKHAARIHYFPSRPPDGPEPFFHSFLQADLDHTSDAFLALPAPPKRRRAPSGGRAPIAPDSSPIALDAEPETYTQVSKVMATIARVLKTDPIKPFIAPLGTDTPLAAPGERHAAILRGTWWLATHFPQLTDDALLALYTAPLEASGAGPGDSQPEEAVTAYRGALERLLEEAGRPSGYSAEELRHIAEAQGYTEDDGDPVEWFAGRWAIVRGRAWYFLTADGDYDGPYTGEEVDTVLVRHLGRAPVDLFVQRENGSWRCRTLKELSQSGHTMAAKHVISDLRLARARFDKASKTLYEAPFAGRGVRAKQHPEVHEWLFLLGGDKLLDWVACAPDLNKMLCAIYFDGVKGAGKTTLAQGLAKLWTAGSPGSLALAISNFNDEIVRCPILLADEELPVRWGMNTTAALRSLISQREHTLTRKGLAPASMTVYPRVVLAANSEGLLEAERASKNDIEAIAQRFLYIEATEEASAYIGKWETEIWRERKIAEHAMWLYENREVVRNGRFWVEGDMSDMVRLLVTGSRWNSMVCEWLVRYLMRPGPMKSRKDVPISIEHGQLYVKPVAVQNAWQSYLKVKELPEIGKIAPAIRSISHGEVRLDDGEGGSTPYFHIDLDFLIAWAEHFSVAEADQILDSVKSGD